MKCDHFVTVYFLDNSWRFQEWRIISLKTLKSVYFVIWFIKFIRESFVLYPLNGMEWFIAFQTIYEEGYTFTIVYCKLIQFHLQSCHDYLCQKYMMPMNPWYVKCHKQTR